MDETSNKYRSLAKRIVRPKGKLGVLLPGMVVFLFQIAYVPSRPRACE